MRIFPNFTWTQLRDGKPLLLLLTLLALFVFLLSFSLGFFATFPDTVLRDRLLSEVNRLLPAGNRLEAETVAIVFPLHLQLSNSRLIMESAPLPELSLATIELSPTLATLIGRSGLDISARSELGMLSGHIARSGEVDLQLRNGRLDLPFPEMEKIHLSGAISSLDLVGQLQAEKGESIRFNAVFDELSLTGAKQLGLGQDQIPLGQLSTSLSGSGRSLQIDQLSLEGGVVTVKGTGRVMLQRPFSASRLELNLNIRPETAADSNLRSLLELLGPVGKDGSHTLQLRGRLLSPQMK